MPRRGSSKGSPTFVSPPLDDLTRWLNIDHGPEHPALSGRATITGPVALSTRQIVAERRRRQDRDRSGQGRRPPSTCVAHARRSPARPPWQRLDLTSLTAARPQLASVAPRARSLAPTSPVSIPSAWQDLDSYLETLDQPTASRSLAPSAQPAPAAGQEPAQSGHD